MPLNERETMLMQALSLLIGANERVILSDYTVREDAELFEHAIKTAKRATQTVRNDLRHDRTV